GTGREGVATPGELGRQLPIVVDFAVEDRPDAAVLAAHRLMARRQIDDLEPAHRERGRALEEESLVVRTSVREPIVHPLQDSRIRSTVAAGEDVADDAAHDA